MHKNYISIIALASIAFNCEAWNIDDQKAYVKLSVKDEKLCCYKVAESTDKQESNNSELTPKTLKSKIGKSKFVYTELTTQSGENLKDSLDNCEKIIKYAWDKRNVKYNDFVGSIRKSINMEALKESAAQQNGLVLLYCAHKYFTDDSADLTDSKTQKELIENCTGKFGLSATSDLKHDINWYLTDKKWNAAFWLKNVKADKHTDSVKDQNCGSYSRYLELKKDNYVHLNDLKVSSTLKELEEFTAASNAEKENIQKLRAEGKLDVVLSKKDLPENILKSYKVPEGVAVIKDECFDALEKLESITLPSSLKKINSEKLMELKNLKEIDVEIGKDGCNSWLFTCLRNELQEKDVKVKVNMFVDGNFIDIKVNKNEKGELYFWCTNDDYLNLEKTNCHILGELTVLFKYNDLKNIENGSEKAITEYFEAFRKDHKCKNVGAILTKEDLPQNISEIKEYRIPKYVMHITHECLEHLRNIECITLPINFAWIAFDILKIGLESEEAKLKYITIEFDSGLKDLETYKILKYLHEDKVKARIDGKEVDIQVKSGEEELYFWCTNSEYLNIEKTNHPILEKLTVLFKYNDLKRIEDGSKEAITAYLEAFKKYYSCEKVGAVLTEKDLPQDKSEIKEYIVPEYVINIDNINLNDLLKLENLETIKVEIADDLSNLEVYKVLKYKFANRVKPVIYSGNIDIKIDIQVKKNNVTGKLYCWCTNDYYITLTYIGHSIVEKLVNRFESWREWLSAIKNQEIVFTKEDAESFKNETYVSIPFPVTNVEDNCFNECGWLIGVVIPNSVIMLGNSCFYLCSNLKAVIINEGVEVIGDSCFEKCVNLPAITIPGSVIRLGRNCFNSCLSLKEIIIKNGKIVFEVDCFRNCKELDVIYVPDNVNTYLFRQKLIYQGTGVSESIEVKHISERIDQ